MSNLLADDKARAFTLLSVPRGTEIKLEQYVALLFECNKRMNLVSEGSLPYVWSRHILDSAQLFRLLPSKTTVVVDLGSGAGFPGIVLAIMGGPCVHLIESIGKKADFLRHVAKTLSLNVVVHQERIEAIRQLKADVITARALKVLPQLLVYAKPLMHKDSMCLFLKGQKAQEELTEAGKYWTFRCAKIPSLSDPFGTVLKISGLKAKKAYDWKQPASPRKRCPVR